jgi:hypothetical protein
MISGSGTCSPVTPYCCKPKPTTTIAPTSTPINSPTPINCPKNECSSESSCVQGSSNAHNTLVLCRYVNGPVGCPQYLIKTSTEDCSLKRNCNAPTYNCDAGLRMCTPVCHFNSGCTLGDRTCLGDWISVCSMINECDSTCPSSYKNYLPATDCSTLSPKQKLTCDPSTVTCVPAP